VHTKRALHSAAQHVATAPLPGCSMALCKRHGALLGAPERDAELGGERRRMRWRSGVQRSLCPALPARATRCLCKQRAAAVV
jgi:hypothetical protein